MRNPSSVLQAKNPVTCTASLPIHIPQKASLLLLAGTEEGKTNSAASISCQQLLHAHIGAARHLASPEQAAGSQAQQCRQIPTGMDGEPLPSSAAYHRRTAGHRSARQKVWGRGAESGQKQCLGEGGIALLP